MAELIGALHDPEALITLAVLLLAVGLFISGALAPELTGLLSLGPVSYTHLTLPTILLV